METGMGRGARVARPGGTAVVIHPLWLVAVPLLSILCLLLPLHDAGRSVALALQPLAWALSLLLHEAGHALAARAFGTRVRLIALMPIGGMTLFAAPLRDGAEDVWVALAGPMATLALAGLGMAAGTLTGGAVRDGMVAVAHFNLLVFAVNTLPLPRLDGGNALRGIAHLLGSGRGEAAGVTMTNDAGQRAAR